MPSSRIPVWLSAFLCSFLLISAPADSARMYRSKAADGSTMFSDAPVRNGQVDRRSYGKNHGLELTGNSCVGLSDLQLEARGDAIFTNISHAAKHHKVDPLLIRAISRIESCFDPRAVSVAGARGLMQLMPATARELGVRDSFNIDQNLSGGADYIASMLKRFNNDQRLALAAYNAGPGAVKKHGGIPPYKETIAYVDSVLRQYEAYGKQARIRHK